MDMDYNTYVTTKRVIIRSKRACLLYYFMLVGLFCYFIVYELLIGNGYMNIQSVPVTATVQAQQPTQMKGLKQALCDTMMPRCHSNFTDVAELRYCNQSNKSFDHNKSHCIRMDALENELHIGSGVMLLTTRWEYLNQSLACPQDMPNCSRDVYKNIGKKPSYSFVADIERWWIWVDHKLGQNTANATGSSSRTQGYVQDRDGNVEKIHKCDDIGDAKKRENMFCSDEYGDHLKVGKLLRSHNIDLDSLDRDDKKNRTLREKGLIMLLHIQYSNHRPFEVTRLFSGGYGNLTYTYTVEFVKHDIISKEFSRSLDGGVPSGKRMRARKFGILVKVQADSSIGVFDFSALILVMVQFGAMLTVAATATDHLVRMQCFAGKHSAEINDTYLREYSVHADKASRLQLAELADKRRKCRDHKEILKAHEIDPELGSDGASDSED